MCIPSHCLRPLHNIVIVVGASFTDANIGDTIAEMPTLPFPPGGSCFYAQNTASRVGCKSPVFHTTLFQNQNDAHIYLFNEWKLLVQVVHEVSQEFRLFTNIKYGGYTCRQGMGHMVFSDCTLWWLPNYAIFLPSGAQISSLFWGLVFLIVIVPGWHLCVISFTSV